MDIKKLQTLVIEALEDMKAQDIVLFDTTHLTSLFDRLVVASGTSNRQTKSLAAAVREKVKENGGYIVGMEGGETGEWVLVDLGDMIVHIMQPAIRAYYRLEEIWGDKEIKLGAAKRVSKRTASEPEFAEAAPKKAARHLTVDLAASELPPKKPSARKPKVKAEISQTGQPKPPAKPGKKPAEAQPAGKTVKVAATKSAIAATAKAPVKRASAVRPKVKAAPAE